MATDTDQDLPNENDSFMAFFKCENTLNKKGVHEHKVFTCSFSYAAKAFKKMFGKECELDCDMGRPVYFWD